MKEGKFEEIKDLYIDVIGIENKKGHIKLSDRIQDLNLGNQFLNRLNNKND